MCTYHQGINPRPLLPPKKKEEEEGEEEGKAIQYTRRKKKQEGFHQSDIQDAQKRNKKETHSKSLFFPSQHQSFVWLREDGNSGPMTHTIVLGARNNQVNHFMGDFDVPTQQLSQHSENKPVILPCKVEKKAWIGNTMYVQCLSPSILLRHPSFMS